MLVYRDRYAPEPTESPKLESRDAGFGLLPSLVNGCSLPDSATFLGPTTDGAVISRGHNQRQVDMESAGGESHVSTIDEPCMITAWPIPTRSTATPWEVSNQEFSG